MKLFGKKLDLKYIGKNEIKFFLGYSGWDSFQLEDEINNSSWTINNNYSGYKKLLKSCKNIWKKNLINLGPVFLFSFQLNH